MNEAAADNYHSRIAWVDIARGAVMMVMALDHASLFWNKSRVAGEGLMGAFPHYAGLAQMATRLCAHMTPVAFLFLAGMMMALSADRRRRSGRREGSITAAFLKRGFLLVVLQFTLANFFFMPLAFLRLQGKAIFFLDILFAIGAGMIVLSLLRRLGKAALAALALASFFIYPLFYEQIKSFSDARILAQALFIPLFVPTVKQGMILACLYPVFPWIGMMASGYVFGMFFLKKQQSEENRDIGRLFFFLGAASCVLFFLVRIFNGYGNALFWQDLNLKEFFALSKYPPDISYFLFSLSAAFFLFSLSVCASQKKKNRLADIVSVFGRVPLFFYCAHIAVYGAVPVLLGIKGEVSLPFVYLIWLSGLGVLYFPCLWFERFRLRANRQAEA